MVNIGDITIKFLTDNEFDGLCIEEDWWPLG